MKVILLQDVKGKGKKGGKAQAAGFEITEDMMKMLGGFTLLRLTSLMGTANVKLTKEDLLKMNAKLNKIKKPKAKKENKNKK